MTLQDFATKETTALVERLLAERSEALSQHVRVACDALEAVGRALHSSPGIDERVQDLAGRLTAAFDGTAAGIREEGRKAIEAVRRELDTERKTREAVTAELLESRRSFQAMRAARETAETMAREEADARAAVDAKLREARAVVDASASRIAELESQLDLERAENAILNSDIDRVRDAEEEAHAARLRAEQELAARASAEAALEQEVQSVRRALDDALAEVADLAAQLEEMAGEKGRLAIDLSAARGELQTVQAQHKAIVAQLKASAARAHMVERNQEDTIGQLQARLEASQDHFQQPHHDSAAEPARAGAALPGAPADVARLASVVEASVRSAERLTEVSSVGDLLSGLARELSSEFRRVAVFRVQANRLQGEHQVGFDYTTDVKKIAMPLAVESLLTRVVRTREAERLSSADLASDSAGAPFRGAPSVALAVPVVLHGEAVAVAYIDDWDHPASASSGRSDDAGVLFAKLVVRHAGVLFVGFAHELRALKELRDYAGLLLDGARQMYDADAEARMSPDAVRTRLDDNLACARQLFAQRAALEGPAAAGLLDEQLEATIESDPSARFARDLAACLVRRREEEARQSAQAS